MMTQERYVPDNSGVKEEAERLVQSITNYYHNAGYTEVKVWLERKVRTNPLTQTVVGFRYDIRSNIRFKVPTAS